MLNLARCIEQGRLNARITMVAASNSHAKGIDRARELGLPTRVIKRKDYDSTEAFSDVVFEAARQAAANLICLTGFLSLLKIPVDFERRVLNIHPSLLPKFGGKGMYGHHVHEAVIAAGETQSGCTVHFADNTYDTGPIILQRKCPVLLDDTPDSLAARVFEQECIAYPEAITRVAHSM